jgi:hypothetical protein
MHVGFRLSLYLDSGAILCRLGSMWASFEAHLDVILTENGVPERLGNQNGARKNYSGSPLWFRFIMNVGFRLAPYTDFRCHFMVFRMHLGFIWGVLGNIFE